MKKISGGFFGACNLCNGIVVKINNSFFGYRCLKCRSTQIHRAIASVINDHYGPDNNITDVKAYELSSRGSLFKFMTKKFKDLTISEYYDDVKPGEYKAGIQCQDVQKLTFENDKFDLITSTEVFEHVVHDQLGFEEIYRVLTPKGKFIFTVPLAEVEHTIERATIDKDGNLIHMLPPEYHGDRIRGKNHVLAFRNYGLDIVERLKKAGFKKVSIERPLSKKYRITEKQVIVAAKNA